MGTPSSHNKIPRPIRLSSRRFYATNGSRSAKFPDSKPSVVQPTQRVARGGQSDPAEYVI
jgi:hypothetical protein